MNGHGAGDGVRSPALRPGGKAMIFKPGQSVEHKGETFTFVNVGVSNAVNYAVLKRTDTNDKRTFEAVKLAEVQPSANQIDATGNGKR